MRDLAIFSDAKQWQQNPQHTTSDGIPWQTVTKKQPSAQLAINE
jgi:hypothetical protein